MLVYNTGGTSLPTITKEQETREVLFQGTSKLVNSTSSHLAVPAEFLDASVMGLLPEGQR